MRKNSIIHAPFTLKPSPFPLRCYEEAVEIQSSINLLVDRLSQDEEFLLSLRSLLETDEYISNLFKVLESKDMSEIVCGINRSDYLLDYKKGYKENWMDEAELKQVEINTISAAFAGLSGKVSQLHDYLEGSNRTINTPVRGIAEAISKCFLEYNRTSIKSPVCLFLVTENEGNIFDQRFLEYELEKHGIGSIRRTFKEMKSLQIKNGNLFLNDLEVFFVYFRAGYAPEHLDAEDWKTRCLIESSKAIKCPNAAYHLVGMKKVQQVMSQPNFLEKYLSTEESKRVRRTFTGLYSLDSGEQTRELLERVKCNAELFVMKPQREGGGNNIYGKEILRHLPENLSDGLNEYILMDLIKSPPFESRFVRNEKIEEVQAISELGIYGTFVRKGDSILHNSVDGYLLRTKAKDVNEGGVSTGYSVLDSFVPHDHKRKAE